MSTAPRRKQPERVRRALTEAAARIAVHRGLADVTVERVCLEAGVTKGAFFHHFPTKNALVETVFDGLLERFDARIDAAIAADPVAHGRFTRAYLGTLETDTAVPPAGHPALETRPTSGHDPAPDDAAEADGEEALWAALLVSMITDPGLRQRWSAWRQARETAHAATDAGPHLAAVRLAADGIWLADLVEDRSATADRRRLLALLDGLTRQPA